MRKRLRIFGIVLCFVAIFAVSGCKKAEDSNQSANDSEVSEGITEANPGGGDHGGGAGNQR